MFTDTKNLSQNSANSSELNSNCAHAHKSKGKFRKVLKPLLRLVKLKSTKSPVANIAHPNNVNLNNANSYKDISELSTTLLEDYAAVIRKVTAKEQERLATHDISLSATTGNPTAVISSVSTEKSPAVTCSGCSHGRNCQHEEHHYDYDKRNHSRPIIEVPAIENLTDIPVHLICTDNGTFFWTTAQEKVDDDLLQAWLCHSFLQLPTEAVFY